MCRAHRSGWSEPGVARDVKLSRMPVYPQAAWEERMPEQVGLSQPNLEALEALVGGRGCVVRHGYMVYAWGDQTKSSDVASAVKPLLSALLLFAIQEGKIRSVDSRVAEFEPRLNALNQGKDAHITWRHFASQTSGYGLQEPPGKAWAYNDYALALYYDTLTGKVFRKSGGDLLKEYLANPLHFQDQVTFEAFGPNDRPGRLAISVRDFARFGLFILRNGKWQGKQLLTPALLRKALSSPVTAEMPRTSGVEAPMLPGQRSLGGGKNQTAIGPGYYSFNWWLNGKDSQGRRLFADAPPDTIAASGHGGESMLWIVPNLDIIVSWNDATVDDQDSSPSNPQTRCNQAARLIAKAVQETAGGAIRDAASTQVTIANGQWRLNGKVTYPGAKAEGLMMNARMVNAVFEDLRRPEFDPEANTDRFLARLPDYVAHGVRAFTLNLQGGMPGYEGAVNSTFNPDGTLREQYMARVQRVIAACNRQGAVVILGCYYQRQDQILRDQTAVRAGVVHVAQWIRQNRFGNVVLEIANEFGHPGFDHPILRSADGQVELMRLARQTTPGLLVSTSGMGDGALPDSIARAADFLLIHFNGTPLIAIPTRISALKRFGKPIMCNEDQKTREEAAKAAALCVENGASWGLMLEDVNQRYPFAFRGAEDDPLVYAQLKRLTSRRTEPTRFGETQIIATPIVKAAHKGM